jgi:hypothetical protein
VRHDLEVRRAVAHALDVHQRVGKKWCASDARRRCAADFAHPTQLKRGSCGKWRVASNLHFMAEGERATEPSREVPPIANRDGGASPSAPVVELREPKSGTPSGMRGRIAVVIGLLLAATLLYIGLFALLHRHQPAVESVFGATGSEPPLDLTLNVLSIDPVREVINVRLEVVEPSESRLWRTLNPADVRGFVVRVDDRYLTFQLMAEASGAKSVLEIALEGSISGYPLDHYAGRLSISASRKENAAPQPIRLTVWPFVSNWNVEMSRSDQASKTPAGIDLNIQVQRPTSFIVMAFAFYAAMALIGLSGLTIGTLVFLGVRPLQPPMTGALAAMIFSIPALRGLMPGAPPLGVHADLLVLVWVQLAVILGLSLFVITWVARR